MPVSQGVLFVISAPTGGGKTTVTKRVIDELKNVIPIKKVITYTTRPSRPGEIDGVDYHFVTEADFLEKKNHNFFLEDTFYDGNWYGSAWTSIDKLKNGTSLMLVTDRPGAKVIKHLLPDSVLMWLDVPTLSTIAQRLHTRGTEDDEGLARRLSIAAREIEDEGHEPAFDYHIMNDSIESSVNAIQEIILKHVEITQAVSLR